MNAAPRNIILTRNDGLGDMLLMLPMCAVIKRIFPDTKVAILGKAYTKSVVDACVHADQFIDADSFFADAVSVCGDTPACIIHVRTNKAVAKRAKALKIPIRIGTSSRVYHWFTCNRLVKLNRKNSDLHEAQLNLKLLAPLGYGKIPDADELGSMYGLDRITMPDAMTNALLSPGKKNLIVHPKSEGSSKEWPLQNMAELIDLFSEDYNIILTGVAKERPFIDEIKRAVKREVTDACGKLSLQQFMSLIRASQGLLANATGPAHLAAALGINCFALYPSTRPIHPARWRPLGKNVTVITTDESGDMRSIKPADVAQIIATRLNDPNYR